MMKAELVKRTVTCPICNSIAEIEALQFSSRPKPNNGQGSPKTSTWADCPTCGHEWKLDGVSLSAMAQAV